MNQVKSKFSLLLAALAFVAVLDFAAPAPAALAENPSVVIATSLGDITVELDQAKAPITVKNFLDYVEADFYKDTVFHRVIPDFMIQGGGMTSDLKEKTTLDPIKNESGNGLSNSRGTIAMARTADPNSATSQFFINVADNKNLDSYGGGYAVFGKVTDGMDVVDKIVGVKTTTRGMYQNVPAESVVIKSITVKK